MKWDYASVNTKYTAKQKRRSIPKESVFNLTAMDKYTEFKQFQTDVTNILLTKHKILTMQKMKWYSVCNTVN